MPSTRGLGDNAATKRLSPTLPSLSFTQRFGQVSDFVFQLVCLQLLVFFFLVFQDLPTLPGIWCSVWDENGIEESLRAVKARDQTSWFCSPLELGLAAFWFLRKLGSNWFSALSPGLTLMNGWRRGTFHVSAKGIFAVWSGEWARNDACSMGRGWWRRGAGQIAGSMAKTCNAVLRTASRMRQGSLWGANPMAFIRQPWDLVLSSKVLSISARSFTSNAGLPETQTEIWQLGVQQLFTMTKVCSTTHTFIRNSNSNCSHVEAQPLTDLTCLLFPQAF